MKRHPNVLWLAVLVLGWLFDFLFWRQSPGVNFAVYVLLCLIAGYLLVRLDRKQMAFGAFLLIPLILFFAAMTFVRAEPLTVGISGILTLFLMALLAITFADGGWLRYTLPDYVSGLWRLGLSVLIRPLFYNRELERERAQSGAPSPRLNLWPVVRGLLISLPVLLVFGALLASADLVFGQELDQFIRLLRLENLPQYIFRLLYILAAAYALAGVVLHAAGYGQKALTEGVKESSGFTILGFVEAAIVLGSVIILFAAFVLVQFRYFFGGQVNIGVEGYTYSEYARRGFGELLIVAFFSLLLILGLTTVTRRENEIQRRLFSGLAVVIVALLSVMLVSAYQRLALYEAAYGFSRLRTYTNVLLIWIGILLVAVVVLEILRRERYFASAALVAAIGFCMSLSLLNVDAFIVRRNVERALRGGGLDVGYLASLSTDSVPALVDLFGSPSYPSATRAGVGAVLACRQQVQPVRPSPGWQSLTVSGLLAQSGVSSVAQQLAEYRRGDSGLPPQVWTPGGHVLYLCTGLGN